MIERQDGKSAGWVDAIDDGRIVRVSEEHARREGLPIIRRQSMELSQFATEKAQAQPMSQREKRGLLKFEEFRRPLRGEKGIINELKDNFHWELIKLRKAKGLTRKQAAVSIGADERELKMLEAGVLSREDYVLINKVENFYKVALRKDKSFSGSALQNAMKSKGFVDDDKSRDDKNKGNDKIGNAGDIKFDDIELDDEE